MEVNTKIKRLREQLTGPPPVEVPKSPEAFCELISWQPDSWQLQLMNTVFEDKPIKAIILAGRQIGKSTCLSVLSAHFAMVNPGSSVVVTSPSLRQSSLLFKKVLAVWKRTGKLVSGRETALSLLLSNSSSIIALPGSPGTVRGHSADLLILDEAQRISPELYAACLPMLAAQKNPKLVMISSAGASFGDFYREWEHGTGYTKFKITADQCPRISKEFLTEQKQRLSEAVYRAEYECEFSDRESSVFSLDMINRCVDPEMDTLDDLLDSIISDDSTRPAAEEAAEGAEGDGISINELGFDFEND